MKKNKRFKIRAVFFCKNQKKASFCHTSIIIGDILHFSIKKTRYVSHDAYLFSNKTSFTD